MKVRAKTAKAVVEAVLVAAAHDQRADQGLVHGLPVKRDPVLDPQDEAEDQEVVAVVEAVLTVLDAEEVATVAIGPLKIKEMEKKVTDYT